MRHRAFTGPDADAKYERAGMWLLATVYRRDFAEAWCVKSNIPIRKAQGEGIDQAGGFLVPHELAKAVLDLRDLYGAFRRRARIWPMASDNTTIPRHAGGSTGYVIGENTGITASSATVDALDLSARKIAALILTSNELDSDSLPELVDYLANEMAFALAQKEDDCAFNGTGASTYGGMVGIASMPSTSKSRITAAHNTYLTLDGTDLGNLMAGVRGSALANAAWFISALGFAQCICRLTASNGTLQMRNVDGIDTPFYLGFPVIPTQTLPQAAGSQSGKLMLAFGDMYAGGVLGQRRSLAIARSDERYLENDQIAIRATERVHCVVHDIGDATNFGSVAALFGS